MKRSGAVDEKSDWKLYVCNHVSGRDFLHSWGPEDEARAELQIMASKGHDVWLISPDGGKVLPSPTAGL